MNGFDKAEYLKNERKKREQKRNRERARVLFNPFSEVGISVELWGDRRRSLVTSYPNRKAHQKNLQFDLALWRAKRRFELGSWIALIDTLYICQDAKLNVPAWAVGPLMNCVPGTLLGATGKSKLPPRLRQREAKRLQRQKWSQVFYAIKDCEVVFSDDLEDDLNAARLPVEVKGLELSQLLNRTNDAQRLALTYDIMRKQDHRLFKKSESSIARGHTELRHDVEDQFGVNFGERLSPWCFLWDIAFVQEATIELLSI